MLTRITLAWFLFYTGILCSEDLHFRFTRSRCGIPEGQYDVNTTKGMAAGTAVYIGFEADWVKQPFMTTQGTAPYIPVQRKRFSASEVKIDTQYVRLQDVELALYETGQIVISGMIWSSGGVYGELKGNNVRVTYKFVGGYRQSKQSSATNATPAVSILPSTVFHEQVINGFVRKNEPSSLHMNIPMNCAVKQHFQEIERVEIQLQVMKDR